MHDLPPLALSVRQPWAWAIIHAGKNIENRDWRQPNPGLKFTGPVCIHASSGMTRDEFYDAILDIDEITRRTLPRLPTAPELVRGAIIGTVEVVGIVRGRAVDHPHGPWFFGPVGLVLRNARPCDPIPCKGSLGFFRWERGGELAPPAKWMLPPVPKPSPVPSPDDEPRLL